MADYKTESDRLRDQLDWDARDARYTENLKLLSEHCHVPVDGVMEFLRAAKTRLIIRLDANRKEVARSSEFADAPGGLTDPELAEWAVQS